jgi:hypothetical protein
VVVAADRGPGAAGGAVLGGIRPGREVGQEGRINGSQTAGNNVLSQS